ncbi:hypothetical protein GGS20DRAFT_458771 [Poronia punctata]|nr:hypothetical protein GGS20DRAFT_458771 [Poronia punctata]
MSSNPSLLMSNNFHLDLTNGGGGKGSSASSAFTGVHAGLFRTPKSPSVSSSVYLAESTGSLQYGLSTPISNFKRKRVGPRELTVAAAAAATNNDWRMSNDAHVLDSMMDVRADLRSEYDLRRTERDGRYYLAGVMDTPDRGRHSKEEAGSLESSYHSDVDYRRALGSKRPWDDEGDARGSRPAGTKTQTSSGWSSFAINTIGGVVGKVWEFCRSGGFRGFYAGGGAGYEMSGSGGQQQHQQALEDSRGWGWGHEQAHETGHFYTELPPSDYSVFHYERETPESTPPPAAKRRQISYGTPTNELEKNWVMVTDPADVSRPPSQASRASSRRPVQRPTERPLARRISKPVSRVTTTSVLNHHGAGRPSIAGSGYGFDREPASFASGRPSPNMKAHTPSRIPVASSRPQSPSTFAQQQELSRIPSPSPYTKRGSGGGHRRTQSAISTSSASPVKLGKRDSILDIKDNSPRLDAKAKSLAAKRIKDEMEADLRINDFNARLKDMIRQGKEALGTTYEVEVDVDDGGGDPWESE